MPQYKYSGPGPPYILSGLGLINRIFVIFLEIWSCKTDIRPPWLAARTGVSCLELVIRIQITPVSKKHV